MPLQATAATDPIKAFANYRISLYKTPGKHFADMENQLTFFLTEVRCVPKFLDLSSTMLKTGSQSKQFNHIFGGTLTVRRLFHICLRRIYVHS